MSALAKTQAAWGADLPKWVEDLALVCESRSMRGVARELGVSPTLISLVLSNKYTSPTDNLQQRFLVWRIPKIHCPILGDITHKTCAENRREPFTGLNPVAVQLYRACHGTCPYGEKKK